MQEKHAMQDAQYYMDISMYGVSSPVWKKRAGMKGDYIVVFSIIDDFLGLFLFPIIWCRNSLVTCYMSMYLRTMGNLLSNTESGHNFTGFIAFADEIK